MFVLRSDFFFLSEVQSGFRTKMQEIKPLPKGLGSGLEPSQQMQWLSHFGNQRSVQIHLYIFKRNIQTMGTAVSQCKKSMLFKVCLRESGRGWWVLREYGRKSFDVLLLQREVPQPPTHGQNPRSEVRRIDRHSGNMASSGLLTDRFLFHCYCFFIINIHFFMHISC